MANATAKQLSDVVGVPVEKLLEQLKNAGVDVSGPDDPISNEDKMKLLKSLRSSHGKSTSDEPQKITLKRKNKSELKVSGSSSRTVGAKTINVERRKKKTFVRPGEESSQQNSTEDAEFKRQREASIEEAKLVKLRQDDEARSAQVEAEKKRLEQQEDLLAKEKANKERAEQERIEEQERINREQEELKQQAAKAEEDSKKEKESKAADQKLAQDARNRKKERETRYGRDKLHVAKDSATKGKATKGGKAKRGRKQNSSQNADNQHAFEKPTTPIIKTVEVGETISVADIARKLAIKAGDVIKELMKMGTMATINQILDQDTAILLIEEMGHNAQAMNEDSYEDELVQALKESGLAETSRPPVVTIMGHVDHGKTSLLDYIRESRVASGEAGGITQHIGAYHVETGHGMITFLDTPGHAAFSAMRARGATSTDIVVLVVSADDGVMPQTKEAVQHSKAAGVPLVIAVNKIDKEGVDPDRVRNELSALDVMPEEWGGENIFINVSALTGEGVEKLLDAILLQAEMMELTAVATGKAAGTVIESSLDKGRGPVATVLVQSGVLKKGDILLAGTEYGRVRAMYDESSQLVKEAGPSIPVQVLGLSGTPSAGDDVFVVENDRKAREIATSRETKIKDIRMAEQQKAKIQGMFDAMEAGDVAELNVLVKADVNGSAEALRESLLKLSTNEVKVRIVADGVGGINESDVNLAAASTAIMIGFNVRADATAKRAAGDYGLDIRYYSVIYDVIDDIKAAMSGLLKPETQEKILGLAEVKDTFKSPKFGLIAGSIVIDGSIKRGKPIRVLRENVVIYEGELESLRRFKDDVDEVKNGTECGIGVKNYTDVRPGDQIEVFDRIEVARTID
ncbi:MAG: translation initiation factor IF-2 [Gammaproteobacteria bacterium]|nr:translation initiation factor IF-2 [Gammaproteobacteria bacterium]